MLRKVLTRDVGDHIAEEAQLRGVLLAALC